MTHNEVCHSSDRPQSGSRNLAYLRSTPVTLLDQGGEKGESDEREPEDVERGAEIGVVHFDGTCRDRAERIGRFRSGLEDRPVDEMVSKTLAVADASEGSLLVAPSIDEPGQDLRERARRSQANRRGVDLVEPKVNRGGSQRCPESGKRSRIAHVGEPPLNRRLPDHAGP